MGEMDSWTMNELMNKGRTCDSGQTDRQTYRQTETDRQRQKHTDRDRETDRTTYLSYSSHHNSTTLNIQIQD